MFFNLYVLMELLKSKNRNLTQCIRHAISVRIINEMFSVNAIYIFYEFYVFDLFT